MDQPLKLRESWLTLLSRIEWLSHLLTQVVSDFIFEVITTANTQAP